MAIEKTIFTGMNQAQNFPEVYAWLTANATEYFDEITQDETAKTIICKIGGQDALKFTFDNSKELKITLKNGITATTNETGKRIDFVVKTSKGLYIKYKDTLSDIFITRDNRGSVAFVGLLTIGGSYPRLVSGSFENSQDIWKSSWSSSGNSMTTSNFLIIMTSSLTSMCAVSCNGEVYTPDVYFVPFTENFGLNGKIACNDTEYYYDGVFALKD